jgi:hypothetical protein
MFTLEQIWQMIDIIKRNQAVFIGSQLGLEYLSPSDIIMLQALGINTEDFEDVMSEIDKSYYFGMMAQSLGGNKSYKVNNKIFDKWFTKRLNQPKSISQKAGLDHLKNRAFIDLSGLGNKVANNFSNTILMANQKQRLEIADKIKTESIKAFKDRKSQAWLASELKRITEDWARDFSRISNYILQEAYGFGRAQQILEDYGDDAQVYKQTFPGVCKQCLKNYGVPGEKPIIYKLKDLIANGNNIGKKDQEPVVGPAHPWARSILHVVPENSEWDDDLKRFVIKRNTQGVKRTSKVKVTITP